ncbi:MAG: hypothetical protein NZL83_02450 [Candidatus Absconditabacterales bacterium]|nr:hypothetical protein [Candidatus Absconditabacterales bacterium]
MAGYGLPPGVFGAAVGSVELIINCCYPLYYVCSVADTIIMMLSYSFRPISSPFSQPKKFSIMIVLLY